MRPAPVDVCLIEQPRVRRSRVYDRSDARRITEVRRDLTLDRGHGLVSELLLVLCVTGAQLWKQDLTVSSSGTT